MAFLPWFFVATSAYSLYLAYLPQDGKSGLGVFFVLLLSAPVSAAFFLSAVLLGKWLIKKEGAVPKTISYVTVPFLLVLAVTLGYCGFMTYGHTHFTFTDSKQNPLASFSIPARYAAEQLETPTGLVQGSIGRYGNLLQVYAYPHGSLGYQATPETWEQTRRQGHELYVATQKGQNVANPAPYYEASKQLREWQDLYGNFFGCDSPTLENPASLYVPGFKEVRLGTTTAYSFNCSASKDDSYFIFTSKATVFVRGVASTVNYQSGTNVEKAESAREKHKKDEESLIKNMVIH